MKEGKIIVIQEHWGVLGTNVGGQVPARILRASLWRFSGYNVELSHCTRRHSFFIKLPLSAAVGFSGRLHPGDHGRLQQSIKFISALPQILITLLHYLRWIAQQPWNKYVYADEAPFNPKCPPKTFDCWSKRWRVCCCGRCTWFTNRFCDCFHYN